VAFDLEASVQFFEFGEQLLLGPHIVVERIILNLLLGAATPAIEPAEEGKEQGREDLRKVGREYVESQRDAESDSYIGVPSDRKVFVVAVEEGDEPHGSVLLGVAVDVEVDEQEDHGDVDELHGCDLLELALRLSVLGVVLLPN